MLIHGKCHCGNIAFEFGWEPDPAEIVARACTCSFCVKHGCAWTSFPAGVLKLRTADAARVSRYTFGTHTSEFHTCTCCGVVPVVTCRIDGRLYAVVNVNTFEDCDPSLLRHVPANLEKEGKEARLDRRKCHWIADVRHVADVS